MRYAYRCPSCNSEEEIIKGVSDIDRLEPCPKCNHAMERYIDRFHFYGANDWDTAQYCPALGQIVKSNKHRRQIAKARGLEEVGNEDPNKLHKHYEKQREKAFEDSWSKV